MLLHLNSNIEIHKLLPTLFKYEFLKYLNSNIEIHKFSLLDIFFSNTFSI